MISDLITIGWFLMLASGPVILLLIMLGSSSGVRRPKTDPPQHPPKSDEP